jgi:hypothetical protein
VRAQVLPGLALDLVDVRDQPLQAAVLHDPFSGGLVAYARHAGEVVAGLADDRRAVAVAVGRKAVPLGDGSGGHAVHLGDPALEVQHGDVVVDQLERVAVAGDDPHVHADVTGLAGERGDHIVGLVAGLLDIRDAQRGEDLTDQAELPGEDVGRLGPAGLVVGVLF